MANNMLLNGNVVKSTDLGGGLQIPHQNIDAIVNPLPAGSNVIGSVSVTNFPTPSSFLSIIPTWTHTDVAHTTGTTLGGILTLPNAASSSGGAFAIRRVTFVNLDNTQPTGYLYVFRSNPTVGTFGDNQSVVFGTDALKVALVLPIDGWDQPQGGASHKTLYPLNAFVDLDTGTSTYCIFLLSGGGNDPTDVNMNQLEFLVERF